ncbi:MAG TPA: hypothetical protein VD926_13055 [Acidimicrobiales bacterium]|nr:hypothetical protein [Acidimicrobiales bacterium]
MPPILHAAVAAIAAVLPWPLKRAVYRYALGYDMHPGARVGLSLITVRRFVLAEGARVGHLNLIRNLDEVRLEEHAAIGNLNWINAVPAGAPDRLTHAPERQPTLLVRRHGTITYGHFLDCSDRVEIGEFAIIGGFRCQILSHSVDLDVGNVLCAPVRLGDYSFVATACVVLPGAELSHHAVVGAASLLRRMDTEPYSLYSGVPAQFVKRVPEDWSYFTRTTGKLD